jgi:hypothetical protein
MFIIFPMIMFLMIRSQYPNQYPNEVLMIETEISFTLPFQPNSTHPYAIFVCLNVDNVSVINHSVKILDYWCLIIMLSSAPTIVHPHLYILITLQVGRSSFTRSFAKDQVLRGPLVYLVL